nr:DUF551 domain-containing protein [Pseudomonas sp.]
MGKPFDGDVRTVVIDALVGMISGATSMTPPTDQPLPDFVQAPVDRAVERIQRLLAQEPACPWIKCSDRLPGDDLDGMAVIVAVVHFKRGLISESDVWVKGSGRAMGRFKFWGSNATHWMPLPEAPAQSGDGEQVE